MTRGAAALALTLALVTTARAEGLTAPRVEAPRAPRNAFGARLDNDVFGDSDRYFTNLFALSYGRHLASLTPRRWGPSTLWLDLRAVQSIFTPRYLRLAQPTWGERPYAGWLRGGAGVVLQGPRDTFGAFFSLGVVGPGALGKQTQRAVHTILGIYQPEGWDTQLPTRLSIQLGAERAHVRGLPFGDGGRAGIGVFGAGELGTIQRELALGVGSFVSWRLQDAESVAVYSPRLGAAFHGAQPKVGLGFAGAFVQRFMLYDHLLETRPAAVGHDVEIERVLYELRLVAVLRRDPVRIRYAQVVQSRAFEVQRRAHIWGIAEVALAF
ncbi:MAG: lipid A deacylase LpxR family protein [Myxococcota bacterium]